MAWGAEFRNNDGSLQIGTEVNAFFMIAKGSFAAGASGVINPGVAFDAVAVKATGGGALPGNFFAAPVSEAFILAPDLGATVNWFCFRRYDAIAPATSAMGLEIRSPVTGNVTFSSLYPKIMRSLGQIPISGATSFSTSLPSGRDVAFISYGTVLKNETADLGEPIGTIQFCQSPTVKTVGSNVEISTSWGTVGAGTGADVYNGGVIAIDVTNF